MIPAAEISRHEGRDSRTCSLGGRLMPGVPPTSLLELGAGLRSCARFFAIGSGRGAYGCLDKLRRVAAFATTLAYPSLPRVLSGQKFQCLHRRCGVNFPPEHFTNPVRVGAQLLRNYIVFFPFASEDMRGNSFIEIERFPLDLNRVKFNPRQGVLVCCHKSLRFVAGATALGGVVLMPVVAMIRTISERAGFSAGRVTANQANHPSSTLFSHATCCEQSAFHPKTVFLLANRYLYSRGWK